MKLMTTRILDKILDGGILIADLGLSPDETIQLGKELEERKSTREDIDMDSDNRVFLQEENINVDNSKCTGERVA